MRLAAPSGTAAPPAGRPARGSARPGTPPATASPAPRPVAPAPAPAARSCPSSALLPVRGGWHGGGHLVKAPGMSTATRPVIDLVSASSLRPRPPVGPVRVAAGQRSGALAHRRPTARGSGRSPSTTTSATISRQPKLFSSCRAGRDDGRGRRGRPGRPAADDAGDGPAPARPVQAARQPRLHAAERRSRSGRASRSWRARSSTTSSSAASATSCTTSPGACRRG